MADSTPKMKYTGIGIEYDNLGMRGVKIRRSEQGHFVIDQTKEVKGNFAKDEDRLKAFKELKSKLSVSSKDKVITCLSGKQIHASQIPFKLMAHDQMASALKIKIRKTIPFEVAGAAVDYQVVQKAEEKDGESEILVSVAARVLLNKQLRELERVGINPHIVDVQPMVIGNALSAVAVNGETEDPIVALHVSPSLCTVIVTGKNCTFFHRNIPFSGVELYANEGNEVPEREKERRLHALGDEVTRSLAYYSKHFKQHNFDKVFITGNFVDKPEFIQALADQTNLMVAPLNLAGKAEKGGLEKVESAYDLAIATALRCGPQGNVNSTPFTTNLIAELRAKEKKAESQRVRTSALTLLAVGILILAMLVAGMKVLKMQSILKAEQSKLELLEQEYKTYAQTRLVVNKQDVELLDTLQGTRIFWTKKLASMAVHLPDNYWITGFGFDSKEFGVAGYGYISKDQEQLVTLDEYLNLMRQDSLFNDDFKRTYLDVTEREDEGYRLRVSFDYSAVSSKPNHMNKPKRQQRARRR